MLTMYVVAGWRSWHLVGLITRRSLVQVQAPLVFSNRQLCSFPKTWP